MNAESFCETLDSHFNERYQAVHEFKKQQREARQNNKLAGLILKDRATIEWIRREKKRREEEDKEISAGKCTAHLGGYLNYSF